MRLLERKACLDELDAALTGVMHGTGRVVLVSGEAGIGKTSLVGYFATERCNHVRVLWGACDAQFTPRPLGPLHDMAAQMLGDFPALLAAEPPPATIFPALVSELQRSVTLVVFEDVHWADEATLDLLRFLGRRIARTRALLVITYRDDELGLHHPLRVVLGDLSTVPAIHRIPLPPLSEAAVRDLIGEREINASTLHQRTAGNPFFITEVLASGGASLPPTVRDAVLARVAQLSPPARAVMEAAAIIGPRIEPWVLADVAGADAAATEECIGVGMLAARGSMLAFRHELARQAILETISPLQKLLLHRRTLCSLQASPETVSPARLAHHAEAARDAEAVLAFAPVAARQAAAAGAYREATALYALALRFADNVSQEQHARLLEAFAQQCDHVGKQEEGIAARQQAASIWHALGNPLKQGENLAHLTNMLVRVGRNADAEQASRQAVALLEPLPPGPELAMAYRMRASLCLVERNYAESLAWADRANCLARQFDEAAVLSAIHITTGTARLFLDYEGGREYMERKLEYAREAGLDVRVAHLYTNLGSGSGELYHFDRAEQYLAQGIAYAAERDLDSFHFYMLAWQAITYLYLGRWQEANEVATRVLEHPSATFISRIMALVARGRLLTRQGDPAARETLDEALELAKRTQTLQRLGPVYAARAEAAWLAGEAKQALEEARAVYELASSKKHPWLTGELAFWRWRAGDPVQAPEWIAAPFALDLAGAWRAAAMEWKRLGCPYEQARALADGDNSARRAALDIFDRLGAKPAAEALRRVMRAHGATVPRGPRASTRRNPFGLTARQMEVLSLLVENLTNSEIAARLHISTKTVDHHVSAVLARLDVHSREDAAQLARSRYPFAQN